MEVECLIETLGCLVAWLFGALHCVFNKLLVVSTCRRPTLPRINRPWFDLRLSCKSNYSAVGPLRKTIWPCDAGHVTCFAVIVRCGILCVLWNLLPVQIKPLALWTITLDNLVASHFLCIDLPALCLSGKETQEVVHFSVLTFVCNLALFLGFVLHLHSGVSW